MPRNLPIFGVLLLAAALRLQQVDQPYVDEYAWRESDNAAMADAFARGDWNIFLPQVRWGGPGPNYIGAEFQTVTYITALGYRVFGDHPWVGRGVCIAFGLWGIFALHQLVERVWDRRRAIASSAVMAVLPGSVFIERSLLSDGAMTALMTTSLWLLVAYCQTERLRYLVGAVLAGMLGCLTKVPGGILVIPALYVVVAMLGTRLRERAIQRRLTAAAVAVAAPVIAYYLWARYVSLTYPPYFFMGEGKFLWNDGFAEWIEDAYFLPALWRIVASEDHLWTWPWIVLAALGAVLPQRRSAEHGATGLFHAWLLAMMLRYVVEAGHLVSDSNNLHLFNPMVAAFAGHALVYLAREAFPVASVPPRVVLLTLVFGASTISGHYRSRHLFTDSYRDYLVLGKQLSEMSSPEDLVISMGLEPVVLHHSRRNGWLFPPTDARPGRTEREFEAWDYGSGDIAWLRELESRGAQWLVIPSWNGYTGSGDSDLLRRTYPLLYAGIIERFDIVREMPEGILLRAK